jgi:hypothetical protein
VTRIRIIGRDLWNPRREQGREEGVRVSALLPDKGMARQGAARATLFFFHPLLATESVTGHHSHAQGSRTRSYTAPIALNVALRALCAPALFAPPPVQMALRRAQLWVT